MKKTVKILVAYHKPDKIVKSDVLVPIHLGRALKTAASKDGSISPDDYQWMLSNMIGDDTGDNISHLNRYFNEMTALYWAWKNYDKLGNPDYIGLMHYRRFFNIPDYSEKEIQNLIKDSDIICMPPKLFSFIRYNICSNLTDYVDKTFVNLKPILAMAGRNPKYKSAVKKFFAGTDMIFCNMFIMKKELFFEYCEFIFDILLSAHKKIKYNTTNFNNMRCCAYASEYLTSIFLMKKIDEGLSYKYIPITDFIDKYIPFNKNNPVCVCYSTNDVYAAYTAVSIQSIILNCSPDKYYEISILVSHLSPDNQKMLASLATSNVNIRFINVLETLKSQKINISDFHINGYFSPETYFRFFIPQLFANRDRVLWLDGDTVVNCDVAELFNFNISDNWFGVCKNVFSIYEMYKGTIKSDVGYLENYFRYKIGIQNPRNTLFQAGVMLFNVTQLRKFDFLKTCMDKLAQIGNPRFVDQDVLNAIAQNKITFLPLTYNHVWYVQAPDCMKNILPDNIFNEYVGARENVKIVHFAGDIKPWKNLDKILADHFWKYAFAAPAPVLKSILAKNKLDYKSLFRAILHFHRHKAKKIFKNIHRLQRLKKEIQRAE